MRARLVITEEAAASTPPGWQHSFVKIDHGILSLPLIQEGQLSVAGKECAQYWVTA